MEWLRIGELARRTGLTQRALRHYDEIGLLVPSGRSGGDYRLYSRADVERLLAIQHLKSLGLSLTEITEALNGEGADPGELLARHAEVVERRIAEERELLTRLRRLQRAAETPPAGSEAGPGWDDVLESIALAERLRHVDADVRFAAAIGSPARLTPDDMITLLLDPDPGVREGAAWAVAHRRDTLAELTPRLLTGDDVSRHALAHVLGKVRAADAIPVLTELLSDSDERVAAKAAFSLGQIGSSLGGDALANAVEDPRQRVRDEAAAALARTPGAVSLLVAVLRTGSVVAREAAADALGFVSSAPVEALAEALSDPEHRVRFAALAALGHLPGDEASAAIRTAADAEDRRERLLARRLLDDRARNQRSAANRKAN
ncbi:MAG: HEAT repeat domain-containing protein [Tessaracoccus sp.]|uniref:HEAT repeat domain-containing protein n=1 Tax=Tessaracoccus sp. TaxID=1971211 RepID=UPI001EBA7467|nr:HEAT repeat domain-containing protein [Tessaracoccus sp.]MBK7822609.1 HEAT repeat domain-containing protein [Tessaracoccus sp.]